MMGHDARHTGRSVAQASPGEPRINNIYFPCETHLPYDENENCELFSGVAIGPDGRLFFGTNGGRLVCLDKATLTRLWSYPASNQPPLQGGVWCTPALGVGYGPGTGDGAGEGDSVPSPLYRVYVTTDEGWLHAFTNFGQLVWSLRLGDDAQGSPVIGADGTLYATHTDFTTPRSAAVVAVSFDGAIRWRYWLSPDTAGPPGRDVMVTTGVALDDAGFIYVGDSRNRLFKLSLGGQPAWVSPHYYRNTDIESYWHWPIWCEPVVADSGTVFLSTFRVSTGGNQLHAVTEEEIPPQSGDWYPVSKWYHPDHMAQRCIRTVHTALGEAPLGPIEGGPFLDKMMSGQEVVNNVYFGTQEVAGGYPPRFVRVHEISQAGYTYGRAEEVANSWSRFDAVGACAAEPGTGLARAVYILSEAPVLYSASPQGAMRWTLTPPMHRTERPQMCVDSNGDVYVGGHRTLTRHGILWQFRGDEVAK
ncbi:MAG: PQQ-like beta-propeller repeat protein [Fimbriimonadia bacterium]|jgi:hypothetical protein